MKRIEKIVLVLLISALVVSAMPSNSVLAAKKVKLNKTKMTLKVGQTTKLKIKGTKKKVKWSSNKKTIATVSKKGVVKAKKKGSAKITAKVGKKKYSCRVTVKVPGVSSPSKNKVTPTAAVTTATPGSTAKPVIDATSIVLSKTSLQLVVGSVEEIEAVVYPVNATDKTIIWESLDENVATVSNGVITTVAPGTTAIIARIGNCIGVCAVNVTPKVVKDFKIKNADITMCIGDARKVEYEVDPIDAEHDGALYESASTDIVDVDEEGNLQAKKLGDTTVRVTIGCKYKICNVHVIKSYSFESIPSRVTLKVGEAYTQEFYYFGDGEPQASASQLNKYVETKIEKLDEVNKWKLTVTAMSPTVSVKVYVSNSLNDNEFFGTEIKVDGGAGQCTLTANVGETYTDEAYRNKVEIIRCVPTFTDGYTSDYQDWGVKLKLDVRVKMVSGSGYCNIPWKLIGDDGVTYAKGSEVVKLSKYETGSLTFYPLGVDNFLKPGHYTLKFGDN